MKYWLIAILTLISMHSYAQEDFDKGLPLANTDGEPNSLAAGCVSVITGNYVDRIVDLVIPGHEPLVVERFYSSSDFEKGCLWRGWRHNHESVLQLTETGRGKRPDYHAQYIDCNGTTTLYEGKAHIYGETVSLPINKSAMKGLTNCCGPISARTNMKNQVVYFNDKNELYQVTTGDGSLRNFKVIRSLIDNSPTGYNTRICRMFRLGMQYEKRPNNNFACYEYSSLARTSKVSIKDSSQKTIFSSVDFVENDLNPNPQLSLYVNNEQKVRYSFQKFNTKNGVQIYLKEAERSDAPLESYEYVYNSKQTGYNLSRKNSPDGRFLEIEYYKQGKNDVGGVERNLPEYYYSEGIRIPNLAIDNVKLLKAPVGTDSTPIITHRFFYERVVKDNSGGHLDGSAEVYDALNHKSKYVYTTNHRLKFIERFTGNSDQSYKVYRIETLHWGEPGSQDESNVISRCIADDTTIIDNAKIAKFYRTYKYDNRGNVIEEKYFGDLTGKKNNQLRIDLKTRTTSLDNVECYTKTYEYSSDNLNLLTFEMDGSSKTILSNYYPNTNLLKSKFICDGGRICLRHFYIYDSNAVLIKKIYDDGNSSNENNLSGVTERHVTYISPKTTFPGFGLPEVIEEKYLEFSTGAEVQLKKTRNTYSTNGRITQQDRYDSQNVLASSVRCEYDNKGNIVLKENELGHVIFYTYDANGNMLTEEGPRPGFRKTFTYDFSNRLIREEEQDAEDGTILSKTYRYDYLSNKISSCDTFGNETRYIYDDFNRLVKTIYPPVQDEKGSLIQPSTSQAYNVIDQIISTTDPRGHTTAYLHNIRGQPVSIVYPDGTKEKNEYNLNGTLSKTVAKNGSYQLCFYDFLNRLTREEAYSASNTLLATISNTYNAHHLLSTTDAEGSTTFYKYDGAGRQIEIRTETSRITYEYDSLGRVAKEIDWIDENEASVKVYVYDLLDRVIEERVEDLEGNVIASTEYEFDEFGNCIQVTNQSQEGSATSKSQYNSRKQPISVTDALGNTTMTTYDYQARNSDNQQVLCVSIIDSLGNIIETTYDTAGRPSCTLRKNTFAITLAKSVLLYDSAGNCAKEIDTVITHGKEDCDIITEWVYNSLNQEISLIQAVGTPEQKRTLYTYNSHGQKESIVKPDGIVVSHKYDEKGRLAKYYSSDNSFSYSYNYDRNDHPIEIQDLQSNTSTILNYDSSGRVIDEILGNNLKMSFTYDPLDRISRLTLPDGSFIDYSCNSAFLKKITRCSKDGSTLYSHQFENYDLSGNLLNAKLIGRAGAVNYRYDLLNRVVDIQTSLWKQTIPSTGFDSVGNLLHYDVQDIFGNSSATFTHNDLYQLTSESGISTHKYESDSIANRVAKDKNAYVINSLNQVLSETQYKYTYDANGNLVQKSNGVHSINYKYDALDRLIKVIDGNHVYVYSYDSFNRRLSKMKNGDPASLMRFIYHGQNEIGSVDAADNITELRILGPTKHAEIGAAVAVELNGNVYSPIHDYHGNVICLVEAASGQEVETYRYSAFGEEEKTSSLNNPWRYCSKRVDPETGFIYFGRRYYASDIGRWITPDPLGFEDGPNLYAYLHNGPLTAFDLYGLINISWSSNTYMAGGSCTSKDIKSTFKGIRTAGAGLFKETVHGMYHTAGSMGEWLNADHEYEFGGDSTAFRNKCERSQFVKEFSNNPREAVKYAGKNMFSGIIKAWNLSPDDTTEVKAEAYTRALFDVASISTVLCKTGGVLNNTGKAGRICEINTLAADVKKCGNAQSSIKTLQSNLNKFTQHGMDRAIERGVSKGHILDALQNPLKVNDVKIDSFNRTSQRFIGHHAEVVINPTTKQIISVNPTSQRKAKNLQKSRE